jgi:hypothetical protein
MLILIVVSDHFGRAITGRDKKNIKCEQPSNPLCETVRRTFSRSMSWLGYRHTEFPTKNGGMKWNSLEVPDPLPIRIGLLTILRRFRAIASPILARRDGYGVQLSPFGLFSKKHFKASSPDIPG